MNELGRKLQLDIRDITPARCDVLTHRNLLKAYHRDIATIRRNPGRITMKTPLPEVETRIQQLSQPVETNVKTDDSASERDALCIALGRVTRIASCMYGENPEEADRVITSLFGDLRDPDRRERAIQRVDTLYQSYHLATGEPVAVMNLEATGQIIPFPNESVVFNASKA